MLNQSNRLRRTGGLRDAFTRQSLMKKLLILASISLILLFAIVIIVARDLPSPGKVERDKGFSTTFLDRDGEVLFEMYQDKNRIPVNIENVPDHLKQATIAIEDKDFYSHQGFSVLGMGRAAIKTIFFGKLEGGSTLTQQLVKNVLLTRERTVTRKIKEFILALEIERRYDKDTILELYLNEAPYGGQFWGIESAAKGYFGKPASELTIVESAFLAGLPQRPSYYSPFIGEKDAYIPRTKAVLRRLREDDYISSNEEKEALKKLETIKFEKPSSALAAPHFVYYVRELVAKEFGQSVLDQGITIKTTLSKKLQEKAQLIVKSEIEKTKALHATNGAAVIIENKTGQILSMIGSYDYSDADYGAYNTAIALRQPGSAVKPITYATAFKQGYTPSTVVMDVATEFPDQGGKSYNPVNYDGKFRGPMQMRFALGNSINIVAVKTLAMVGIKPFLETANDLGLTTFAPTKKNLDRFGLAITLGGGEVKLLDLTSAYSVFGRGGERIEPSAILEIKDYKGHTLFKAKKVSKKRVLSEEISFLISHILADNNARVEAFGASSQLVVPGKTVAVKTGTTNDKRDNWTVGYTREVTTGVWVGNNDNSPMSAGVASGLTGASSIWNKIMREVLKDYKDGIASVPGKVKALEVDALFGGLPKDGSNKRSEYFLSGTEPKSISSYYKKIKLSRADNSRLANEIEIKKGEYEEREYFVPTEADPISRDGKNRWQEGINAWVAGQGDSRYKVPTDLSGAQSDDVIVTIQEPKNEERVNHNDIKVRIRVSSVKSIRNVKIFINDSQVKSIDGDNHEITEMFNLSDGTYNIGVKAENTDGKTGEAGARIGVNRDWFEGLTLTITP